MRSPRPHGASDRAGWIDAINGGAGVPVQLRIAAFDAALCCTAYCAYHRFRALADDGAVEEVEPGLRATAFVGSRLGGDRLEPSNLAVSTSNGCAHFEEESMSRSPSEVEGLLRERGFALTPQRRAIVRHLLDRGGHQTASEILEGITREFPLASRATVYSTLALLRELGVVSEVPGPGAEARYDANADPHQHFVCRRCGRLEDVPDAWFPVGLGPAAPADLAVVRFRVTAEGICAACRDQA